jgi:hypothetical protein
MSTLAELNTLRDMLAETNAKQIESAEGNLTLSGEINRYFPGIPEPLHDAALEFLSKYTSAENYDVVEISDVDGDPSSIPAVPGLYKWTFENQNGQPIRSDGEFWLKLAEDTGIYNWEISDINGMVLFRAADVALEDAKALLDTGNMPFVGQDLSMSFPDDSIIVKEYGWAVGEEFATYSVTGAVTGSTVVADASAYGVVVNPLVDGHIREGTWSGGAVKMVRVDGATASRIGKWMLVQTLWKESSIFLLVGKTENANFTEETRMYPHIPTGSVTDKINEVSVLNGASLVDSNAVRSSIPGTFDVFVRLRTLKESSADILVGLRTPGLVKREVYLRQNVPDDEVADAVAVLGAMALMEDVRSTSAGEPGFMDIFYTKMVLPLAWSEFQSGVDRRQNVWDTANYNYVSGLQRILTGVSGEGVETFEYVDRKYRVPIAYFKGATNQWRLNSQVAIVTYSATQPGAPTNNFAGTTGNGGTVQRLPNGLFVSRQIATTFTWW